VCEQRERDVRGTSYRRKPICLDCRDVFTNYVALECEREIGEGAAMQFP
jgi:hypothetical protein